MGGFLRQISPAFVAATWMLMPWSGESQRSGVFFGWFGGLGAADLQVTIQVTARNGTFFWRWTWIFLKKTTSHPFVVWFLINFLALLLNKGLTSTDEHVRSHIFPSVSATISLRCARDSWLFARHSATPSGAVRHQRHFPGKWCRGH